MSSLHPLGERTFYVPGANNIGVIAGDDRSAILVDTGLDKDVARVARRAVEEAGLRVRAIISTHHHADHIGGNDYLLRNLPGVEVYAPRREAPLIENPELEPIYLGMGAAPIAALKTRWLMARPSPVHHLLDGERAEVAGVPIEIIPLPGHSLAQVGVAVDGVCFAADGFFGPAILGKHGVPYAHDVGAQLASLRRLAERPEHMFLPGHGEPTPRGALADVLGANQAAIERARELVRAALAEPAPLAHIAGRVQRALGVALPAIPQYAIFVSAVAAHLSHLEAHGAARVALEDDGLIWHPVAG